MSNNVFGDPVTDMTVQQVFIGIGAANITARHRAEVALIYMNDRTKAQDARKFVSDLSSNVRNQPMTLCTIYNATGDNLSFVSPHTWEGNVWSSPYPNIILNGQWAAFLHVSSNSSSARSKAAVAYRGVNVDGRPCNWVLGWNTSRGNNQNGAYAEAVSDINFINWNLVNNHLESYIANHMIYNNGCFSSSAVGGYSSVPHFTGIMGLANNVSSILPGSLGLEHIDDDNKGMEVVDDDEATPAT